MEPTLIGPATAVARDDAQYDAFLGRLQARFDANLATANGRLFTTDAVGLFDAYLDALPGDRQYHTCHACRRFVETFGGLVTIGDNGQIRTAIWDERVEPPGYYSAAVYSLARLAHNAKVTGVFLSRLPVWGQPITGPWHHLAVTPPENILHRSLVLTPGQAMAEKSEDYRNVARALAEFNRATVEQALKVLESEALYRGEKVLGPAKWLHDLHVARDAVRPHLRENVLWRAIASAPAGFCHPRASMAGTLLEDIAAGMDFAEVSRRFASKLHPLSYQRPQAAPSAGNIAAAEKLVEQMGITRSLLRRFARLDDIETLWTPTPETGKPAGNGVFGHLKPKGQETANPIVVPPITMTWDKFARTVLPGAGSIDFYVPPGYGPYVALTTAVDPDAPPILQWDRVERRNPVAWYVYTAGSPPEQWGLTSGRYHKVNALALNPAHRGGDPAVNSHHAQGVVFVLDGARDSRQSGLAIFPETLKSELHAVRTTIEAFSRAGTMEGAEEASACGLVLSKGGSWGSLFRVTSAGSVQEYRLDRWD